MLRLGFVIPIGNALILIVLLVAAEASAQQAATRAPVDPFGAPTVTIRATVAGSPGDALPFWLHANERNRFGTASSAALFRVTVQDRVLDAGPISLAYGMDAVGRHGEQRTFYLGQIYGAARYGALQLRLGRIEETTPTVHYTLSSGSFAVSDNATPLPGASLSIPSYAPVPLTNNWVEVKGYLGHHWFESDRFVENPLLHTKYGYLRIGRPSPLQVHAGLVHTVMWGGSGHPEHARIPQSWRDYVRVFLGREGGEGAPSLDRDAPLGSHLGHWDVGVSGRWADLRLAVYRQFFFDDVFSFRLETPEDGILGISLRREEATSFITGLLWEFLYTRTQSDRNDPATLGQVSNYYNHYFYRQGYTYHGQTLGSPLLFLAKEDFDPEQDLTISHNNRVVAHHIGLEGFLSERVAYRILGTYSRNYGNYADLFEARENGAPYRFEEGLSQYHLLLEGTVTVRERLRLQAAAGLDVGEVRPDAVGARLGLHWSAPFGAR